MNCEERISQLEKRVAELEKQLPTQPIDIEMLSKIISQNITREIRGQLNTSLELRGTQ
jgi:uncharacterized coiled-coil protein SlyX